MSERYDLVVRGRLVTPGGTIAGGWLAVSGERIAAIGTGTPPEAKQTHDAGASYVLPGVVDGQTHAGSYGGLAGIKSTTRGAVAGGVTTIVDMPYDNPDPLTTVAHLERKVEAIQRDAYGDVALYGTIAKGQGTGEIDRLAEGGICALKISAFESHPTRFPRIPADETLALLEASVDTGLPVGLHNEDQEIVRSTIARFIAEGKTAAEWHPTSRPLAAEMAATAQFLELGAATDAWVHIVHFSDPGGYQLVRRYRDAGVRATAELCVHYLHFDAAKDMARLGARLKVNPPIRSGVVDGLWRELEAGTVEFVSSDHSSWPVSNKLTPSIFDAGAGIPGLATLLPSFFTDLEARVADPAAAVAKYLSERPAKFFGLWPRKGALAVGADADIVVLQPGRTKFDASSTEDGLNWSPYDGETFTARPVATFVRGRMVFDGTSVVGPAGHGRYIARRAA